MKILNSLIVLLLPLYLFAQTGSINIKNNVNIILISNVNLIIDQPSSNGIIKSGSLLGGIISNNEQSRVVWVVNANIGTYTVPFKYTNGNLIPLISNITIPGTSATKGKLFLSTYHTDNLNNPYPNGYTYFNPVTNMWYYDFTDNSANVVDRFWIVIFSNYSTNPTATLTLTYDNSELNGIIPADLQAQYWSGTCWVNPPLGVSDPPNRNVNTILNVNYNAPWVVSNRQHPLPIELLNFDVKYDKTIKINWVTVSETNNDYFVIEKSFDLLNWDAISVVKGAGNSNSLLYYTDSDNEIVYGKEVYYRLKQVDYNGAYSYSNIKSISVKNSANPLKIDKLYIVEDILSVELSKTIDGKIEIIEIASGKVLMTDVVLNSDVVKMPVNSLKPGIYIIRILSNDGVLINKFKI